MESTIIKCRPRELTEILDDIKWLAKYGNDEAISFVLESFVKRKSIPRSPARQKDAQVNH